MDKQKVLGPEERSVLLALIEGIPLVERPYMEIGQKLGLSEDRVIEIVKILIERGIIRRLGATLRHNLTGYEGNAMVAWKVPEDRLDEVGSHLAEQPFVSHCYVRETYPDWPYNLYTMCHAKTKEELNQLITEIAEKLQIEDYQVLYTIKEIRRKHAQYKIE